MSSPRSFVRMFKPQFADLVRSGAKSQTVRPTPKRRPEPGDRISLRAWTGRPYNSKQEVLREAEILGVIDIAIYGDSIHLISSFGDRRLTSEEREEFARADGFPDFEALAAWFRETHDLPFHGILIRWDARDWQPMETAPKEGYPIEHVDLLLTDGKIVEHAHWAYGGGEDQPAFGPAWFKPYGSGRNPSGYHEVYGKPTHWRPSNKTT